MFRILEQSPARARSLAKLSAFDFVVTIPLGSTLNAVLLKSIPLATGIAAFVVLLALQYVVSWLSSLWQRFEAITRSVPDASVGEDVVHAALQVRYVVRPTRQARDMPSWTP